jgi:hypothetical protein
MSSPVRAPPLCPDDVHRNEITTLERRLPVAEPCSPLATSPLPRSLKETDATFFFHRQAPHRGWATPAMGCLHRRLPELHANTAHPSDP